MRRRILGPLFTAAFLGLISVACAMQSKPGFDTPQDLLSWIDANPNHVGLAAFTPGHERDGIFLNATRKFPLASTFKVLTLGAYALEIAHGHLDPNQEVSAEDIDRWYSPTDGGAHQRALRDWSDRKVIKHNSVPLQELVWAMIRWSDNASADYVLDRVGGPSAALAFATRMGMVSQEPPRPILGEFAAWSKIPYQRWKNLSPPERAARATELAAATTRGELANLPTPSPEQQIRFAALNTAGTPDEWAHLLATFFGENDLPALAKSLIHKELEWPLQAFPQNRERFEHFASKGGSLAGVLTEVSYIAPKEGEPLAVALFLRDVPLDTWTSLLQSFVHQRFIVKMADHPKFFHDVRARLSGE